MLQCEATTCCTLPTIQRAAACCGHSDAVAHVTHLAPTQRHKSAARSLSALQCTFAGFPNILSLIPGRRSPAAQISKKHQIRFCQALTTARVDGYPQVSCPLRAARVMPFTAARRTGLRLRAEAETNSAAAAEASTSGSAQVINFKVNTRPTAPIL